MDFEQGTKSYQINTAHLGGCFYGIRRVGPRNRNVASRKLGKFSKNLKPKAPHMETIDALERKLHAARRGVPGAKYQTGLIIDLNGPAGNIFYLMGVCNRLVRELGLSAQL